MRTPLVLALVASWIIVLEYEVLGLARPRAAEGLLDGPLVQVDRSAGAPPFGQVAPHDNSVALDACTD